MSPNEKPLLTFFGVPITYVRSAIYGSLVLVIVLTIAAILLTDLTPLDALIAGFIAMLLFWLSDIVHQYGHAVAAKRTGYPLSHIRMRTIISITIYPATEPQLSPDIHIQRALGGPIASAIMTIIVGILTLMFWEVGGMLQFLLGYTFLTNLFLAVGSLAVPLYTDFLEFDGGTILHYWRIKQQKKQNS